MRRQLRFENLERREMLNGDPTPIVPPLSSLPGAPATLYLDFDGHFESLVGFANGTLNEEKFVDVDTPVFDLDGDATSFSPQEVAVITEIFDYVAEDFAAFNINVTTIDPGNFSDYMALRVSIGGTGDWYNDYKGPGEDPAGGVSFVGTFNSPQLANIAHVFAFTNSARVLAETVSHEAGHGFGLEHHPEFDSGGLPIPGSYQDGNAKVAPIMGNAENTERGLWWTGHNEDDVLQVDVSMLGGLNNGFGFALDDHGDTIQLATSTSGVYSIDGIVSVSGLDNSLADKDFFEVFAPLALLGNVEVTVLVPQDVANLDVVLEVYNGNGQLLATADPGNDLGASVTLSPGQTYYVAVMGHNRMGSHDPDAHFFDLGSYTLYVSYDTNRWTYLTIEPLFTPLCDPLGPLEAQVKDRVDPLTTVFDRQLTEAMQTKRLADASAIVAGPDQSGQTATGERSAAARDVALVELMNDFLTSDPLRDLMNI